MSKYSGEQLIGVVFLLLAVSNAAGANPPVAPESAETTPDVQYVGHGGHPHPDGTATDRLRVPPQSGPPKHSMIELFLEACRQDKCREVSLLYDPGEISLMTCLVFGQVEAAKWIASRPGWVVTRWSCRFGAPGEVDT
jgi:hypothetical protein